MPSRGGFIRPGQDLHNAIHHQDYNDLLMLLAQDGSTRYGGTQPPPSQNQRGIPCTAQEDIPAYSVFGISEEYGSYTDAIQLGYSAGTVKSASPLGLYTNGPYAVDISESEHFVAFQLNWDESYTLAVDPTDGAPEPGYPLGWKSGSWEVHVDKWDFECISYDNTLGSERAEVKLIHPGCYLATIEEGALGSYIDASDGQLDADSLESGNAQIWMDVSGVRRNFMAPGGLSPGGVWGVKIYNAHQYPLFSKTQVLAVPTPGIGLLAHNLNTAAFICKAPGGGITGYTSGTPGSASCAIHLLDLAGTTPAASGASITVNNMGSAITGSSFFYAIENNEGLFIAAPFT